MHVSAQQRPDQNVRMSKEVFKNIQVLKGIPADEAEPAKHRRAWETPIGWPGSRAKPIVALDEQLS